MDEPGEGRVFRFCIDARPDRAPNRVPSRWTNPFAWKWSGTILLFLIERKPHAGMDMLTVLGRHFHTSQKLVRTRASRNPNDVIEERETTGGERVADAVARFGGSWSFIILFSVVLSIYTIINVAAWRSRCLGPIPVYSAQPVTLDDCGDPGTGHHDESEPAGQKGPPARRAGL